MMLVNELGDDLEHPGASNDKCNGVEAVEELVLDVVVEMYGSSTT